MSSIFDYYMKSIFEDVISNIKEYQKELEKEKIDDYFKNNNYISKKDFTCAIRLFITLVFFPEEDKEIKIKNNKNNIIKYLKSPDLWKNDLFNNEKFNKNLNELKSINIQINQVISLYETLGKDIEDNFFYDVKQKIEEEMNLNIVTCALNGGEDYELLFTCSLDDYEKLIPVEDLYIIGHITKPEYGCNLIGRNGEELPLKAQGWNAFEVFYSNTGV